ncbi:MAG: hypothetical protein GY768_25825 [Planctomycetaceae bacterium]|nr:hypothetical protein [Planctomycetaceae bacterium]
MKRVFPLIILGYFLLSAELATAQTPFTELMGSVRVQPVEKAPFTNVPYITWGGDVATFLANGGLQTTPDSTYGKMGLKLKLTPGDDFVGQVKDYISGKSPFLRGTMRMLGQASEVLGKDPRTKPVIILQLSWSAGDHIVSREGFKTLNDLRREGRKVKIACQQGGPHVGLLYDSLDAAKIDRNEIEIVWVDDLTGPNGPADAFRNDDSIDACCVITPDMIGLTGGYDSTGSGAEGTVKGAKVLNSTRDMSRSIADVYAVRSDWYKANQSVVDSFVAGYLKKTEELVKMRKQFEESQRMSNEYREALKLAQTIFGSEVLPTLEVDAHGLLLDCGFVGLPGQIAFFQNSSNLSGFNPKMKAALDLATAWGYATIRSGFDPPSLNYQKIAKTAGIKYETPDFASSGSEVGSDFLDPGGDILDDRTIVSFTISFQPNQENFSADRYGSEFNRAIQAASTFGNAAIIIRGHADPTKSLLDMIKAGLQKGTIKRSGQSGNYSYFVNNKKLELTDTDTIIKLIQTGQFESANHKPRETVNAALNLSMARAKAVKNSLIKFAKNQNFILVEEQLKPTGAGISEPLIPKPSSFQEAQQNMRVEFRIVRVPAEAINESDFAF